MSEPGDEDFDPLGTFDGFDGFPSWSFPPLSEKQRAAREHAAKLMQQRSEEDSKRRQEALDLGDECLLELLREEEGSEAKNWLLRELRQAALGIGAGFVTAARQWNRQSRDAVLRLQHLLTFPRRWDLSNLECQEKLERNCVEIEKLFARGIYR